MKFELEPDNKNIVDEELITDLRRVASELKTDSLTQREYKKHGKYGVTIFWHRFYGWSKALAKADLKNGKSRTKFVIKDAELIADLKRISLELKNDSITKSEYNCHGKFNSSTFESRFGSWIKAKEKADLKRKEHPSISDEEYFKNLEEVWTKFGKQPHFRDMQKPSSKYSGSSYVHNFGTWRKALKKFIEYVNKEETVIAGENSMAIEESKSHQMPIIEYPNKEIVLGSAVAKIPSVKRPKVSQESVNKRLTKRDVNHRLRFKVMKRDNFRCKSCGRSPATDQNIILHVDHIKAWANGGETILENLQTLCSVCNIGKSDEIL